MPYILLILAHPVNTYEMELAGKQIWGRSIVSVCMYACVFSCRYTVIYRKRSGFHIGDYQISSACLTCYTCQQFLRSRSNALFFHMNFNVALDCTFIHSKVVMWYLLRARKHTN